MGKARKRGMGKSGAMPASVEIDTDLTEAEIAAREKELTRRLLSTPPKPRKKD